MTPDALRRYDRRHGLLALLLLALLVLLPLLFGIGPMSWRSGAAPSATAPPDAAASLTVPAVPAAPAASPAAVDTVATAGSMPEPAREAAASAAQGLPQEPPSTAAAPTAAAAPAPASDEPPRRMLFADASHRLPAGADKLLAPVVAAVKADPSVRVVLSGYHSKGVKSLSFNRELARRRAAAVARRLQALGVPAGRIEQVEPVQTLGGDNAREARRVEIQLRR